MSPFGREGLDIKFRTLWRWRWYFHSWRGPDDVTVSWATVEDSVFTYPNAPWCIDQRAALGPYAIVVTHVDDEWEQYMVSRVAGIRNVWTYIRAQCRILLWNIGWH